MSNTNNTLKGKINTNTIIGLGLLTAIVVVMQFISMGLRFGTFSITLTLIPIVVGSALYGWLGRMARLCFRCDRTADG